MDNAATEFLNLNPFPPVEESSLFRKGDSIPQLRQKISEGAPNLTPEKALIYYFNNFPNFILNPSTKITSKSTNEDKNRIRTVVTVSEEKMKEHFPDMNTLILKSNMQQRLEGLVEFSTEESNLLLDIYLSL
jgi:hypothetical protein